MFVGKALSLICYCYPASERGSKLARGWNSFSPWGDSGPSTREGGTRVSIFYKYTCYVTRRVTDLLDAAQTFCVGQLLGANPNIVHRSPSPAGDWGVLPTYGLLRKLTVLCPL